MRPLHIFEERYRAMVAAAAEGEGLIAMGLLRPGWEDDYQGSPSVYDVGTIGRIEDLVRLPDGRYNLRLVGLQKVRFCEEVQQEPFRMVRVEPLAEIEADEHAADVRRAKLEILASHGALLQEMKHNESEASGLFLDESIPFGKVVNCACANLPIDPAIKQSLLEENDLMERHHRVSALLTEVLENVLATKARRSEDEGETPLLH
jgi:Lon protease-like protein